MVPRSPFAGSQLAVRGSLLAVPVRDLGPAVRRWWQSPCDDLSIQGRFDETRAESAIPEAARRRKDFHRAPSRASETSMPGASAWTLCRWRTSGRNYFQPRNGSNWRRRCIGQRFPCLPTWRGGQSVGAAGRYCFTLAWRSDRLASSLRTSRLPSGCTISRRRQFTRWRHKLNARSAASRSSHAASDKNGS
jgi:hypothetical protein